jgi:glycosyltransferase involved in cell wall biosynthesis
MPKNDSPVTVLLDTSPLVSGHAIRGIGGYTRWLAEGLEELSEIQIIRSIEQSVLQIKPQVVHYPFFDFFFPTLPLKPTHTTIVTIHDVIPLVFSEYYKAGIRARGNFIRQKIALHFVKAIITDSENSRQDIIQYLKVPAKKVHVVYLAGNPQLQAQPASKVESVHSHFKLPKKYVLYVGDINYNKNIPQLIKSLKFLPPDVHLVCVGKQFKEQDIPEWSWINAQLALSDVHDRVQFITNISSDHPEELAAVYSGALCYVQPSIYEGFGLPVLEAMQCKTPVVATGTSSLPEVGGVFALYAQPRAESFAQQVTQILEWSKAKRMIHIQTAYDWSHAFSWKKTAFQTAEIYKLALKE